MTQQLVTQSLQQGPVGDKGGLESAIFAQFEPLKEQLLVVTNVEDADKLIKGFNPSLTFDVSMDSEETARLLKEMLRPRQVQYEGSEVHELWRQYVENYRESEVRLHPRYLKEIRTAVGTLPLYHRGFSVRIRPSDERKVKGGVDVAYIPLLEKSSGRLINLAGIYFDGVSVYNQQEMLDIVKNQQKNEKIVTIPDAAAMRKFFERLTDPQYARTFKTEYESKMGYVDLDVRLRIQDVQSIVHDFLTLKDANGQNPTSTMDCRMWCTDNWARAYITNMNKKLNIGFREI